MNMTKLFGGFAALSLAAAATAAETTAPTQQAPVETGTVEAAELTEENDCPISIELSMDVLSDYVFRGYIFNDNPVWQPSVTLTYETEDFGGVYANAWSSFDLTRKRGYASAGRRACGLQELDYQLAYFVNLFGLDFEAGHYWYTYPNGNGSSEREIYASVSYENPFLTPTFAAYWMYSGSAGTDRSAAYYNVSIAREFEIGDSLTLTPHADLGFGGNAWCQYVTGADRGFGTELTDQTIGLSADYAITEHLSVGAQINYTWIPSKTLRHNDYMGRGKDQLCWGGVNVTLSF